MLFPEWLQTALLVVLLALVVKKTATKGAKQWKQEQKAKAEAAEVRAHGNPLAVPRMFGYTTSPDATGAPHMLSMAPKLVDDGASQSTVASSGGDGRPAAHVRVHTKRA